MKMKLHASGLYLESQKESKRNQKENIDFIICFVVSMFKQRYLGIYY